MYKCHELKAATNTLKVRVSKPSFREGAEIRIAYFQERHQRGNLMSQMSCIEEEVGPSNLVSASKGNRPMGDTFKATGSFWTLSSCWKVLVCVRYTDTRGGHCVGSQ